MSEGVKCVCVSGWVASKWPRDPSFCEQIMHCCACRFSTMSSHLGIRVLPGIGRPLAAIKFTEFFGSVSPAHLLPQVRQELQGLARDGLFLHMGAPVTCQRWLVPPRGGCIPRSSTWWLYILCSSTWWLYVVGLCACSMVRSLVCSVTTWLVPPLPHRAPCQWVGASSNLAPHSGGTGQTGSSLKVRLLMHVGMCDCTCQIKWSHWLHYNSSAQQVQRAPVFPALLHAIPLIATASQGHGKQTSLLNCPLPLIPLLRRGPWSQTFGV